MIKLNRENSSKIINWIGLVGIGIICYCYSLFHRFFAELNIEFSFLDFPVFIGEFFLIACLILFFTKLFILPVKLNKWHYLIFIYFIFILGKAFYGYSKWGPLAFRNAALFYYPLFALIGYNLFEQNFFKNKYINYALIFIFIASFFTTQVYKAFYFTYFMLILFLLMGIKNKIWKYVAIVLFLFICYKSILITIYAGRNGLVSSILSYTFLSFVLVYYFLNLKSIHKAIIFVSFLIVFVLSFWYLSSNKIAAKSLVDIKAAVSAYKEQVKVCREKEKYFNFSNPKVKVYEKDNVSMFGPMVKSLSEEQSQFESQEPLLEQSQTDSQAAKSLFLEEKEVMEILNGIDEKILEEIVSKGSTRTIISRSEYAGQYELIERPVVIEKGLIHSEEVESFKDRVEGSAGTSIVNKETKKEVESFKDRVEGSAGSSIANKEMKKFASASVNKDKEDIRSLIARKYLITREIQDESRLMCSLPLANTLYRVFIIHDMLEELLKEKKLFGADFGKPFRSKLVELSRFDEGWKIRVGWVEPHNSYVHMIYRSGIVGFLFIVSILGLFFRMIISSVRLKDVKAIFLISAILYWLINTNFMVILELPQWAIPFWCLFGMTLRYCHVKNSLDVKSLSMM